MKSSLVSALALLLLLSGARLQAQSRGGGMGGGGGFDPGIRKLLGANRDFSCDLQFTIKSGADETVMGGKMAYGNGKSRFEIDLTTVQSASMPPQAMQQIKMMGMAEMTTITLPDAKTTYIIYPKLKSYTQQPIPEAANRPEDKFKVETTEIGKEQVNGHPCVKMKYVVTDDQDQKREGTVWNATDLKNFPVRVTSTEGGKDVVVDFKNVKLDKPADSLFVAPKEFTSYPTPQALMQDAMMKQLGGGAGLPPSPK